jgi:hypothetical protein
MYRLLRRLIETGRIRNSAEAWEFVRAADRSGMSEDALMWAMFDVPWKWREALFVVVVAVVVMTLC